MIYSALPDGIEMLQEMFGKVIHCKKCGLTERITDEELMKATKIEFFHECRRAIGANRGG